MNTLYKKLLPLAVGAALTGGFATTATADVIAQSVLEITNFKFVNTQGVALSLSQFANLTFSDSSDISVSLNGVTDSDSVGPVTTFTGINQAQICLGGPCPVEDDYTEKSVATTTMARGDTLLTGAPIVTFDNTDPENPVPVAAGASAHTVAEAQLTSTGIGSAQDNLGLVATVAFALNQTQAVGVMFDINAWLKAFVSADSAPGSVAEASLGWSMSLADATGNTLFDWTPGATPDGSIRYGSDCNLDRVRAAQLPGQNATYDCAGAAYAYTNFDLVANQQYTLNLRHSSAADASMISVIPEPATLGLLGLGLLGMGFAARKRKA